MFRSSAAALPPSLSLRIVSYNVLSSHLASPSHFTTLNPSHLDASARLPVILKKLEAEISDAAKSTSKSGGTVEASPAIIFCLQEVSYDWAGQFHKFFANKGYHMVSGLYGRKFNGYMGVCLAWPMQKMETVDVNIARLSDMREGGWPVEPEEPPQSSLSKLWTTVYSLLDYPMQKLGLTSPASTMQADAEPWDYAQRRMNVILTATLRDKDSGQSFCIANYHMPCSFWDGRIMTIHADMAVRHVQRLASEAGNLPYIFAGDFNIKPTESVYRFLTTGELHPDDPSYPTSKGGYEWKPSAQPVRSAYAVSGGEPDFTNYARVKEDDPFIDTLDYIYLSPTWNVVKVLDLPKREDAGGPFPNLDRGEPSDHLLIAVTLSHQDDEAWQKK